MVMSDKPLNTCTYKYTPDNINKYNLIRYHIHEDVVHVYHKGRKTYQVNAQEIKYFSGV